MLILPQSAVPNAKKQNARRTSIITKAVKTASRLGAETVIAKVPTKDTRVIQRNLSKEQVNIELIVASNIVNMIGSIIGKTQIRGAGSTVVVTRNLPTIDANTLEDMQKNTPSCF